MYVGIYNISIYELYRYANTIRQILKYVYYIVFSIHYTARPKMSNAAMSVLYVIMYI